jgi:hypothetical protein
MLKERNWVLSLLLISYAALFEALSWWASKFPPCAVVSQYQRASYQPGKDACASFSEAVIKGLLDAFHIMEHHDNIIAFGTIIIAVFTFTLWRSTDKLWNVADREFKAAQARERRGRQDRMQETFRLHRQMTIAERAANAAAKSADAADRSARATVAIQLPIIRISPNKMSHGDSRVGTEQIEYCSVDSIILSNLGATKAFPKEILYGWTIGDALPAEPSYRYVDSFLPNYILEADPSITPHKRLSGVMTLKAGQWSEICKGNCLWFYCELLYDDFMGESRSHGFCWCWANIGMGMGWRIEANPSYNRKT